MRIFIIGPMASGKSTIGQKLAKSLGLDFIDTDKEIERLAGVNISWIFDIEGEDNFRLREEKVLQEVSKKDDCVISTGGGIVLSKENRELLNASGLIIYLKVAIQTQLERTLLDKSRPLLKADNKEQILRKLQAQRAPLYEEIANITIKEKERSHNEVIKEIVAEIGNY
jgi:shikimate kinase